MTDTNGGGWERELEQLLAALEANTLDAQQRARLNAILRAEPAAREAVADLLEVDALLRWHHGAISADTTTRLATPPPRRLRAFTAILSAAALLTIAAYLGFDLLRAKRFAPRTVETASGWSVQSRGDADFDLDDDRVVLRGGELRVRSTPARSAPLTIETPNATAQAKGTNFFIGYHEPTKGRFDMGSKLTRVLVLAGTVSLSNAHGSAQGSVGSLLTATEGESPTQLAATSGNDFGFDLYRRLIRDGENEDLFFSPYSIAQALTMTAEGARGETAEQMGRVLRLPPVARRVGDDTQQLPFEWSKIHSGYAHLNRLFDATRRRAERNAQLDRLEAMQTRISELNQEIRAARASGDRDRVRRARTVRDSALDAVTKLSVAIKTYELGIANALWGERTYPFAQQFVNTISASYDTGAIVSADFAGDLEGERRRMNAWVAERTDNRITELIGTGALPELTRLVLLNAVHFMGDWVEPFDPNQTKPRPFTLPDGNTRDIPTMQNGYLAAGRYAAVSGDGSVFETPTMRSADQTDADLYPDEEGFTMLELPYRGGDLAMLVLLPRSPDGLARLDGQLSAENLARWTASLQKRQTGTSLPRFNANSAFNLKRALEALGMPLAFTPNADFSGMSGTNEWAEQLYIDKVLHEANITVNELGTEAAAATAVIMRKRGARRAPFHPTFRADHPFVYLIRDVKNGTVLFLGRFTRDERRE